MTVVDKDKLLTHLDNRIQTYGSAVAIAVIDGLKTAVIRGDFDEKKKVN